MQTIFFMISAALWTGEPKSEQMIRKNYRCSFGILCVSVQKLEGSWWNENVWGGEESVKCQKQDSLQYSCCFKYFFIVFVVLWKLKIFPVALRSSISRQKSCRKAWLQFDVLFWEESLIGRELNHFHFQQPLSWLKMNQSQFFVTGTFSFSCCFVCIWDHNSFNSLISYLFIY